MSIGSILMQPGKLQRAAETDPSVGLVEDVLNLLLRILVDRSQDEQIYKILEKTAVDAGKRIGSHVDSKLDEVWKRLQDWLKPLIKSVTDFAESFPDTDDAGEVVEFIMKLLSKLGEKTANLSIDQLRQPIEELLDIFQKELGLAGDFIEQQVMALMDDLIARLENISGSSGKAARKNSRQMAVVIRRLKRILSGQFTIPEINADQLAGALLKFQREYNIETIAKKIACYGDKLKTIFSAVNSAAEVIPYKGFGSNTAGAAEASDTGSEKYLWYASWLLGGKEWKGADWAMFIISKLFFLPFPTDGFYFDSEKKKLVRKKLFVHDGEETLDNEVDNDWTSAEPLKKYTFNDKLKLGADRMEGFAKHSSYICDILEGLWHVFLFDIGDWLSHVFYIAINTLDAVYKMVKKEPFYPQATYAARFFSNLIGSLPWMHTKASAGPGCFHWFTRFAEKMMEGNTWNSLFQAVRDFLLSLFTLMNHKSGEGDNQPENYKEVGGFVNGLVSIFMFLLFKFVDSIPQDKKNYGFAAFKRETGDTLISWLGLGSWGFGVNNALWFLFFSQCIARNFDKKVWKKDIWGVVGIQLAVSLIVTTLMYFPLYYSTKEGGTDKGKYNPTSGIEFDGYPDFSDSPYKLPFEKGKYVRCSQGNQGIWSHNNFSSPSTVYAYDFDLDQDEKVVASREGIVVDYFDWVPDEWKPSKKIKTIDGDQLLILPDQTSYSTFNFIVIKHDGIDPGHDKDEGGREVTTYCVYKYGRKGSIRKVFGDRDIMSVSIIGSQVEQGQVIMLAGSQGKCSYNHLHIEVRPGPAVQSPPSDLPVVPLARLVKRTIPFVFRDAKPLSLEDMAFGHKGVPTYLHFYKSDNG